MSERNKDATPKLGLVPSVIASCIVVSVSLACGAGIGCLLALPALLISPTAFAICAIVIAAIVSGSLIVELPDSTPGRSKKFGYEGLLEDGGTIVATKHYIEESLLAAPPSPNPSRFAHSLGQTIESFSTRLREVGITQQDVATRISILGHLVKRSARSRALLEMWRHEGTLIAALRLRYAGTFAAVEPEGRSILDALDEVRQTVDVATGSGRD